MLRRTHHVSIQLSTRSFTPSFTSVLLAASLCVAVTERAFAQNQVQPNRVGGSAINNQVGNSVAGNRLGGGRGADSMAGQGNALGDGNRLGGQTFSWARGAGAGTAQGAGDRLDANSQVGSGGSNTGSLRTDYNARNLIVTNNVPGGRGFRGSVGYRADTDFRGAAGSDALFRFRADSAFSNPVFATSALANDRFRIAQGLGVFEYRRDSTPIGTDAQRSANDQPESRLRLDRANAQQAIGRMNWDAGQDRFVATSTAENGDALRFIVSPLRGLQTENMTDPVVRSGLGMYEAARARRDIASGFASAADYELVRSTTGLSSQTGTMVDTQIRQESLADTARTRSTMVLPSAYQEILDSVNKAAAKTAAKASDSAAGANDPLSATSGLDRVKSSLDALNPSLTPDMNLGANPGNSAKPTDTPITDSSVKAPRADPLIPTLPGNAPSPLGPDLSAEEKRNRERGKLMSVPEVAEALRHGQRVEHLDSGEKGRVDELVRDGEAALRAHEYFKAERKFDQAQVFARDNPLVDAGMAHAQLGAGLYLSSALTLRNLFTAHPELIDAKYDTALLPAKERLDTALALMRDRILRGDDAPSYGFVVAYLGHQLSDRAMVSEGLSFVKGNERLDTSRALLESIWLGVNLEQPAVETPVVETPAPSDSAPNTPAPTNPK